MNPGGHALTVLEFSRVLDLVAGHASSAAGAARTRQLQPLLSEREVAGEHARVEAMRAMVGSEAGWHPEPIPDLAAALGRLRVEGTAWTALELRAAVTLLLSSRRALDALHDKTLDDGVTAPLESLAASLVRDPETEREIDRVIKDDATVRDDASPLLRRVRKELRGSGVEISLISPVAVNTELGLGLAEPRQRQFRKIEPLQVAEAIVQTLRVPKFDVHVPKALSISERASALMPIGVQDSLSRLSHADDVLSQVDTGARADYELRAARSEPGLPPAPEQAQIPERAAG